MRSKRSRILELMPRAWLIECGPFPVFADCQREDEERAHRARQAGEGVHLVGRSLSDDVDEARRPTPSQVGGGNGVAAQPEVAHVVRVAQRGVQVEDGPAGQRFAP